MECHCSWAGLTGSACGLLKEQQRYSDDQRPIPTSLNCPDEESDFVSFRVEQPAGAEHPDSWTNVAFEVLYHATSFFAQGLSSSWFFAWAAIHAKKTLVASAVLMIERHAAAQAMASFHLTNVLQVCTLLWSDQRSNSQLAPLTAGCLSFVRRETPAYCGCGVDYLSQPVQTMPGCSLTDD